MSDRMILPVSDEIEKAAGHWLERQDFGDLTADDEAAFASWLAQSVSHRVAYVRLRAAWGRTARLAALRTPMRRTRAASLRARWPGLLRHAIALGAIAAVGTLAASRFSAPKGQVYSTAIGDREIITLADGSHVELNTNTTLRADITAKHRIVTLEKGEAFLDIKHDAGRPFVVRAQQYRITDLGTKFVVRTKSDRIEVSLVEGSTKIESADAQSQTPAILMKPGETAIAHNGRIALEKKGEHRISEDLGWRRGVVIFDNTTLADAVAELNRYNRQQLAISDTSIARLKIVGTFPATDLELVLAAAEEVYGLRITRDGNTIRIHR